MVAKGMSTENDKSYKSSNGLKRNGQLLTYNLCQKSLEHPLINAWYSIIMRFRSMQED